MLRLLEPVGAPIHLVVIVVKVLSDACLRLPGVKEAFVSSTGVVVALELLNRFDPETQKPVGQHYWDAISTRQQSVLRLILTLLSNVCLHHKAGQLAVRGCMGRLLTAHRFRRLAAPIMDADIAARACTLLGNLAERRPQIQLELHRAGYDREIIQLMGRDCSSDDVESHAKLTASKLPP